MISPARDLAFRVLKKVQNGGYASDLLRHEGGCSTTRDAGLAETIVFGVPAVSGPARFPDRALRRPSAAQARPGSAHRAAHGDLPASVSGAHSRRTPRSTESVELVKLARKLSAAGFVNAVLRKVHRNPVKWPDRATELSIPAWMLERWSNQYGAEAAENIARAALERAREPGQPRHRPAAGPRVAIDRSLARDRTGDDVLRRVRGARQQDRADDRSGRRVSSPATGP